jgi:sulfoxide reductase catalytic subunit YedY
VQATRIYVLAAVLLIASLLIPNSRSSFHSNTRQHLGSPHSAFAAAPKYPRDDPEKVKQATALLHETGEPQDVNLRTWRLQVKGSSVDNPLRLSYRDLLEMEMIKRNAVVVCPGAFSDRADWEGVHLETILRMAEVHDDYTTLMVVGLDGFTGMFSREEIDNHVIFLALKVNGVTLPKEHGFPVRVVAEDILGGKWVKWIDYIEIY